MGIGTSEFDREALAQATWLVPHDSAVSPWAQFALHRYSNGFAATGVAASIALPRLLRRRLQDWAINGCVVHLGPDFVSYGRSYHSLSSSEAPLFYGVDVRFGDHARTSWLWYCRASEWLLQLHKAVLEPLPPLPASAGVSTLPSADVQLAGDRRWPGRPRYLYESDGPDDTKGPSCSTGNGERAKAAPADSAIPSENSSAGDHQRARHLSPEGAALPENSLGVDSQHATRHAAGGVQNNGGANVEQQLTLFLSNADGHVGQLSLPVPNEQVAHAEAAMAMWRETVEVPLEWAGESWSTSEDFARLRETAFNMPDLLLLGLETELAMTLTPDWTWEKYPRGCGEVTYSSPDAKEVVQDMSAGEQEESVTSKEAASLIEDGQHAEEARQ